MTHGEAVTGPERSVRQVVHRLAGCWRAWGEKHGYFDTAEDAQAFYDEIAYMLLTPDGRAQQPAVVQHGAELGLRHHRPQPGALLMSIPGQASLTKSEDAYTHPQPHACFIQSVRTIWSTTAGSWTCGCARRGCSSTARARARISPSCAARASRSPAAASAAG